MNKRSAMAMAAGVVAALLAGVAAVSIGLSSPTTAQADPDRAEPIVRTVRDTVTVHQEAEGDPSGVVRVVSAPAQPLAGSFDDDALEGHEDDWDDDDRYEDDDHEDHDRYEDEDHDDEDD